jgi:predicted nucleic acid-binding protein
MAVRRIVGADTSALIGLARCDSAFLLAALFDEVRIPQTVWVELAGAEGNAESAAIGALGCTRLVPDRALTPAVAGLGRGEAQVILEALPERLPVLLDDHAARQRANALGLAVIGSLGVLVQGKRQGHLATIAPAIATLASRGHHLGEALIRRTLREAGED